jgi:hypothetical protein
VQETKSRYVVSFPFDKQLTRGKEYAWEAIILNPEEVTIGYEELTFVDEETGEEIGPRRMEQINAIDNDFQQFEE